MPRRGLKLLVIALCGLIVALALTWLGGEEPLTQRLDHLGFFAMSRDEAAVRAAVREQGGRGVFAHDGRVFAIDAAELTPEGVVSLFQRLEPFLEHQRVRLDSVQGGLDDTGQWVEVDERRVRLASADDLERAAGDPKWLEGAVLTRLVRLLNLELGKVGSAERAWVCGAESRRHLVFLSPAVQRVIRESWDGDRSGLPYLPDVEKPAFGWPG